MNKRKRYFTYAYDYTEKDTFKTGIGTVVSPNGIHPNMKEIANELTIATKIPKKAAKTIRVYSMKEYTREDFNDWIGADYE